MASIIRPASFCGAFGWKPTHGTLSTDGVQPLSPTLDHLGVISQHIEDAWAVGTVIASATPGSWLSGRKVELPVPVRPKQLIQLKTAGWIEADEASRAALNQAMLALARDGVEVIDSSDRRVAQLDSMVAEAADVAWRVFAWESQSQLKSYRDCGEGMISARLGDLMATADRMTPVEHRNLLAWRERFREAVSSLAENGSAFVTLSSSGSAPLGLENTGSRTFAAAWTLLGGPSCSLPVLDSENMPLGLQLMAAPGADGAVISAARWIMNRLAAQKIGGTKP
jgi:Asp-tRNA(Asn)/Glu-tRNA(Gln) amidotransferase A subunit family amidase